VRELEAQAAVPDTTAQGISRRYLDSILAASPTGHALVRDRVLTSATRRFEETFGYDPGEMEGMAARRLFADEQSYSRAGARSTR